MNRRSFLALLPALTTLKSIPMEAPEPRQVVSSDWISHSASHFIFFPVDAMPFEIDFDYWHFNAQYPAIALQSPVQRSLTIRIDFSSPE